jgi:hypothetical protein
MKIFLSVAGPDRSAVEEVALALKDEGHRVFLDEYELPPGSSYHRRIREAIAQADLAVFFISPLSVQTDRYTLSELKLMQEKWSHPRGRVLPTMITPTDMKKVPAYLRAVTIYKPQGNVAAEVAFEISRMAADLRRGRTGRDDAGQTGGVSIESVTTAAFAAFGLALLTILVTYLTNELSEIILPTLHAHGLRFLSYVLHGVVLALTVSLALLLFGIVEPVAFGVLAAGCIAAYTFDSMAHSVLPMSALDAAKSMIFALFAAVALPAFRSVASWVSLAVVGLIAGQLADSFQRPLKVFIWEALLVAGVAFFLAFAEPRAVRAG